MLAFRIVVWLFSAAYVIHDFKEWQKDEKKNVARPAWYHITTLVMLFYLLWGIVAVLIWAVDKLGGAT